MKKGFTPAPIEQGERPLTATFGRPKAARLVRGFTLIELLIVIGVLAILATVVVLVLNPAEKLREARDTKRISDLRTVNNAINFYRVRASNPSLNGTVCTSAGNTFPEWRASIDFGPQTGAPPTNGSVAFQPFVTSGSSAEGNRTDAHVYNLAVPEKPRDNNGSGWVAVNFQDLGTSVPLAKLPIDPINSAPVGSHLAGPLLALTPAHFYAYQCFGLRFEINANMESIRYGFEGSNDAESTDGGVRARILPLDILASVVNFGVNPYDPLEPSPASSCTAGASSGCFGFHNLFPGTPYSPSFIADHIYEVGDRPGFNF